MLLTDLLQKLRVDVGDPDGTVFSDDECKRALGRAVTRVNMDLSTDYVLDDTELTPDPMDDHLELLLLAAHAFLAGMRRSASATTGMMFQSGDKKVDKSKRFASWASLCGSLWEQYRRLVASLTGTFPDADILTAPDLNPVIYERASEVEE